ncbi:MAG: ABC transporter permease [Deltaproteobacteria bacterium]|nr:ABC transporter permease [Deltaproteobacteria bacterium]
MSPVAILLKKELTDSLRDRRTLITMILVPLLLYPGMLALIGAVTAAGKARLAREELTVALTTGDAARLVTGAPPAFTRYQQMERPAAELALREQQVAAVVHVPEGSLAALEGGGQLRAEVLYTKRFDRSVEALDRMRQVLSAAGVRALVERLEEAHLPASFAEPVKSAEIDVDFDQNLGPLLASRMLPLILLAMLFMGALYPALDVTAGEKERGTLETLLVAPVHPREVMLAKYLTVALIATVTTLMNLLAMGVTFHVGLQLAEGPPVRLSLSALQIAVLLVTLIPVAFLSSGVALAVASLARSFKEGQSLMTPVMLVGTVPGILALAPGIELNALTAAVPLLNVALLVKATLLGSAAPLHVAIAVGVVSLCSVASLALASNAFQSEALRFGGAESWRDLFRVGRRS